MSDGVGIVLIVALFAGGMIGVVLWSDADVSAKTNADRLNWTSIQVLDLPVNVTRTILPDGTTFTLAPTGDEKWVFFTFGNSVSQSFSATVQPYEWGGSAYGMLPPDTWPSVDLKIVRVNGTEEHYTLPTRGGEVR